VTGVLIVGATSAIARAVARRYADDGARLFLVGRSAARLEAERADLRVRGAAAVEVAVMDALEYERHEEVVAAAIVALGRLDRVLIAHGSLPDQRRCEQSAEETLHAFHVNLLSAVSLLTPIANRMEAQRGGRIAVIGSVAGDRGRQSNYVYGSAKGGLDVFLQGLRNRLHGAGVEVITVKPGFVDTPMTAHLPKNPLYADPARVGARIHAALEGGGRVVYAPWFWRPVMAGIRAIPERLFQRLRL
jgi:decaprenylphospho-beta-D-erythro-pentofuranosid-2-ulose 2-reductase